jgi:hypothetical protein
VRIEVLPSVDFAGFRGGDDEIEHTVIAPGLRKFSELLFGGRSDGIFHLSLHAPGKPGQVGRLSDQRFEALIESFRRRVARDSDLGRPYRGGLVAGGAATGQGQERYTA